MGRQDSGEIRCRASTGVSAAKGSSQAVRAVRADPQLPRATVDVNTLIGPYPYRYVPHPDPEVLVSVLQREGLRAAWVGHLPSAFYRDPSHGNEALFTTLAVHREILHPVPAVRPDWPDWERTLRAMREMGAVAIRAYPPQWGMASNDPHMARLASACGEMGLPLVLTVRFEDMRQRHHLDVAGDLDAATIRSIVRADRRVRVLVTAAGRGTIEESHWGLTPEERSRLWWDISWIWGPPEDHLAHLFQTIGSDRFVYGSHWPMRLTQNPRANLELLPEDLRDHRLADAAVLIAR
jgi:predicted TIM-barrel fold metal-dependent hydrolase